MKCDSFTKKVDYCGNVMKEELKGQSMDYIRECVCAVYARTKALRQYTPNETKLKSKILLTKAKDTAIAEIDEDFGLSKVFANPVAMETFSGDHVTVLDNDDLADSINNFFLDN